MFRLQRIHRIGPIKIPRGAWAISSYSLMLLLALSTVVFSRRLDADETRESSLVSDLSRLYKKARVEYASCINIRL